MTIRSGRTALRYRSTKAQPCPICGGLRCMLFVGGETCSRCSGTGKWRGKFDCAACAATGKRKGGVICRREAGGKITGGGSYFSAESDWKPIVSTRPAFPSIPRASIERRHQAYSSLLETLPLHGYHADHLTTVRKLSEETIVRCQFASVPKREDGDWLAQQFAQHAELTGIPGFWKRFERWVMAFSGTAGFFVPIRNLSGQIEALQIRRDHGAPKYLLFSSSNKPSGCNSGAPVHFARVGRDARSVIVTEGALKAEIVAERLRCPVIGLVGVGLFSDSFGVELRRELPPLQQVLIGFDQPEGEESDRARENVARQLDRLHESLRRAGLRSETMRWSGAKGLDDYLNAQEVAA